MIKYDVIKKFSGINPEKLVMIDGEKKITWKNFEEKTLKMLHLIKSNQDFNSDNLVLYFSKNSSDIIILGAAFSTLGIPFQGVDYWLSIKTIRTLVTQLKVKCIFVDKFMAEKCSSLKDICSVYQVEDFAESAEKLNSKILDDIQPVDKPFRNYSFTSGTTGIPKVVYRTSSFDKRRFEFLEKQYKFNSNDIHLVCLPLYHVGTTGWLRLFLGLGATLVIHNYVDGYQLCEALYKHQISTTLMSPFMLRSIVQILDTDVNELCFPHLKFIITGGKNCPISVKKAAISKLGDVIHEYYGTTETGINTLLNSQEALQYPGSVGKAFEGNKVLILDENNELARQGKVGRIAIHSYMTMAEYIGNEASFITIGDEKYLLTADYGYKNSDGYLFVAQRASATKKDAMDLYKMENEILNLGFIGDVSIRDKENNNEIEVNLVPIKYISCEKLFIDINNIAEKHGVKKAEINIMTSINYTSTGKVSLSLNSAH